MSDGSTGSSAENVDAPGQFYIGDDMSDAWMQQFQAQMQFTCEAQMKQQLQQLQQLQQVKSQIENAAQPQNLQSAVKKSKIRSARKRSPMEASLSTKGLRQAVRSMIKAEIESVDLSKVASAVVQHDMLRSAMLSFKHEMQNLMADCLLRTKETHEAMHVMKAELQELRLNTVSKKEAQEYRLASKKEVEDLIAARKEEVQGALTAMKRDLQDKDEMKRLIDEIDKESQTKIKDDLQDFIRANVGEQIEAQATFWKNTAEEKTPGIIQEVSFLDRRSSGARRSTSDSHTESPKKALDHQDAASAKLFESTQPLQEKWEDHLRSLLSSRPEPDPVPLALEFKTRKKGSSTSKSSDQELERANSLSCLRDVSSVVTKSVDPPTPQYMGKNTDVPVVIVTSEVNPFSKTGGLAMVCQSYGIEFPKRGHRTMVVSPMYDNYPNCDLVGTTRIWLMHREVEVKFFHQSQNQGAGVWTDFVFVDHPCYRKHGRLYCDTDGTEYEDNLFRFALFSIAALEVTKLPIGPTPYGEKVVFVTNDWQSALLPVYLVHRHRPRGEYKDARCIFVVHNFGFQGIYPLMKTPWEKNVEIHDLGLDPNYAWHDLIYTYPEHERRNNDDDGNVLNLSKAALMTADRIVTVSPGYASEMKTAEASFQLMDTVKMRSKWFGGILNGIDVDFWNPMTDPVLPCKYGPTTDFLASKLVCKNHLQKRLSLKVDSTVALVSFVGRLADQKGIDIILKCIDWFMTDTGNGVTGRVQLILMGHGDRVYGDGLRTAEQRYPGRVCGYVGFDPELEHLIYGGSDLFLMPSRYEPCGLAQMYATRYGCVPIVTLCGGLKDSVVTEPPEEATGFGILPCNGLQDSTGLFDKLKEVTYIALTMFNREKNAFQAMQARCMQKDFSWCRAMDQYEQHLDWALRDKPYSDQR